MTGYEYAIVGLGLRYLPGWAVGRDYCKLKKPADIIPYRYPYRSTSRLQPDIEYWYEYAFRRRMGLDRMRALAWEEILIPPLSSPEQQMCDGHIII